MHTREKLFYKLLNLGFYPVELPERLYHSLEQRSAGAWSWFCRIRNKKHDFVGSSFDMKSILNSKNILISDTGFCFELDVDPIHE